MVTSFKGVNISRSSGAASDLNANELKVPPQGYLVAQESIDDMVTIGGEEVVPHGGADNV